MALIETVGKKSFVFCESDLTYSGWTPIIWTNVNYINLSRSNLSDSATIMCLCVSQNSVYQPSIHLPKFMTILVLPASSCFSFQRCEWDMSCTQRPPLPQGIVLHRENHLWVLCKARIDEEINMWLCCWPLS